MSPRIIDENASHELRGHAKKLCPVLPAHAVLLRKFQKELIYEGGGLECVLPAFAAKVCDRQSVKFVINKRHQLIAGLFLTIAPSFQELCDAVGRASRHSLISFYL